MDEAEHIAALKRENAAREAAETLWPLVENAYAKGQTLEAARVSVIEAHAPELIGRIGGEAFDRMVQMIMQTGMAGIGPTARKRHAKRVWTAMIDEHVAAGGTPPGPLARWLHARFGLKPRGLLTAKDRAQSS